MTGSWQKAALQEVAEIFTGTTPLTQESSYYGGTIPFVTPAELDAEDPLTTAKVYLSDLGAERGRLLPKGSVLVSCIGSLGKVGMAGVSLVTNQQINALVFKPDRVFPRYGYHFCRTLKPILEHIAPSTTLKIVNKSRFSELSIPLPPISEQRRIAAILDKADELREMRKQAIDRVGSLTQALFVETFATPGEGLSHFPRMKLEDVATKITDGEHLTPRRSDNGIKLLSARNVRDGFLDFEDVDHIDHAEYERIKTRCNPEFGDVLISCSGTIGRVATVETREPLSLVRSVALIKPKTKVVQSKFLECYLRTPRVTAIMRQRANASSQANLFQNQIRQILVEVPPMELQEKFVRGISRIVSFKAALQLSLQGFDALFASVQHRAFTGEL